MKKLLFLSIISMTCLSFTQKKHIYMYRNETDFLFFDENKVILIHAIDYCFEESDTLSNRDYRKRIRKFNRKLKFFKNGQITASDVCNLFSDQENPNKINYKMVKKNLPENKDDLAYYLGQQGFTVLNFWHYQEDKNTIDVQYYIGSEMDCIFYNFKIVKNRNSAKLVKGDSGLILVK